MTTQTRLFLTAGKIEADRVFSMLERAFEEDGLPISTCEVDEDREIFEVSVYTFEPDEIEPRIRDILGSDAFGLELKREAGTRYRLGRAFAGRADACARRAVLRARLA